VSCLIFICFALASWICLVHVSPYCKVRDDRDRDRRDQNPKVEHPILRLQV
jgi:hypothetical protein